METNIKINLDTRQAKAELQDLNRSKTKTKKRLLGRMRSVTLPVVGAVGGYAAISRAIRKARGSSGVDPWSAALGPVQAAVQEYIDKKIGYSAKARRRARDQVASQYATGVHFAQNTAVAQEAYEDVLRLTEAEEIGRNIARQVMRGPSLQELIMQAAKGYKRLIDEAFLYIYDKLTS